jgi:2-phosphosulfolactate phosphatase
MGRTAALPNGSPNRTSWKVGILSSSARYGEGRKLPPETNGTRIVEAARGAPAILAGAFVNAHAVADRLAADESGSRVVIVGCGWRGRRASEDESAAGAILSRLRERGAGLDERAERGVDQYRRRSERSLRNNSAARRLMRLGYKHDLDICLALNAVSVSPRLLDGVFMDSGG